MPIGGSHEPCVLVVDAHGLVATSLATALRHVGFRKVATVDPDEVHLNGHHDSIEVSAGDIALVGLLYGDGRTTLPLIRPLSTKGCRVLVMTSDQGLPLAGECLRRGAEAVIDKGMSFEHLVAVLRHLSSGGCAMTQEEREALLESVERHQAAEHALEKPFQALTEREKDILSALIAGRSPKQIAHLNGITVSTVRGHIQGVLSKLDVNSQREALAMARHAGWS
ncbi:MAG TPA: response regulator transcription factor [Chloroflexota bacterium]|nr:response regulator transcription factor [Chloroflexota bacterium]